MYMREIGGIERTKQMHRGDMKETRRCMKAKSSTLKVVSIPVP